MLSQIKKVLFSALFIAIALINPINTNSIENFLIEPYLQNISNKSINILWQPNSNEIFKVKITDIKKNTSKISFEKSNTGLRNLKVKSLNPQTLYKYTLFNLDSKKIFSGKFKTLNYYKSTRHSKISIVGDSGFTSPEQYQIAEQLYKSNPDIILHAGDIVYPSGKIEDYAVKYFLPFKKLISRYSVFPCVGNHDAMNIKGFDTYFYTPNLNSKSPTNRYYSFNNGLAHITVIDTNLNYKKDSVQYRWIENDLSKYYSQHRLKKFTKIVMFHHPPYSSGTHGEDLDVARELTPLFSKYNVKLVISGHEHNYERIKREKDINGSETGPLYLVTGGGGVATRAQSNLNYKKSEIFISQHHYLKLLISRKSILGKAINKDGHVIDQWKIN